MRLHSLVRFLMLSFVVVFSYTPALANAQPVVRAVLFWMDTCGHCHYVLEEVLPPLQERYGDSLDILLLELKTEEDINRLFQTAATLEIPKEKVAVPFMLIGDHVLIGAQQIPQELPGLIETYLTSGGIDYPNLAPLAGVLPGGEASGEAVCLPSQPCEQQPAVAEQASGPAPDAVSPSAGPPAESASIGLRSSGFTLAMVILICMVVALVYSGFVFWRGGEEGQAGRFQSLFNLGIPLLSMAGLGVAGYLAYVESQAVTAVCGPVGDCNAVQSSPYARLFGVLPVGVLGLAGYLAILVTWAWKRLRPTGLARYAPMAIVAMALLGTLFSVYLTYLELFVIRAVCIWCLSSAVLITLLLLVSVRPALLSLQGEG